MRAHVTPEQRRERPVRAPARATPSLAAAIGNRAFSELVARRRLQRADVAAEPPVVSTDFGTFAVHPDSDGELPVAEPGKDHVWPIHESLFTKLQASMTAIAGNQGALRVAGRRTRSRDEFLPVVLLDLAWLQTQPVGAELIAAILSTDKVAMIVETPINRTVYGDEKGASDPKVRSNARIDYDPTLEVLGDGSQTWMHRPPAIGLAHELVHAWTGMIGIRAPTDAESERQAEGVGEFADARFTENRFRKAFGLDPRTP
jgi:hypothetical protein